MYGRSQHAFHLYGASEVCHPRGAGYSLVAFMARRVTKKLLCKSCGERMAETCGVCMRCYKKRRYHELKGVITRQDSIDSGEMLPAWERSWLAKTLAAKRRREKCQQQSA